MAWEEAHKFDYSGGPLEREKQGKKQGAQELRRSWKEKKA